jgi:hypothetical protein
MVSKIGMAKSGISADRTMSSHLYHNSKRTFPEACSSSYWAVMAADTRIEASLSVASSPSVCKPGRWHDELDAIKAALFSGALIQLPYRVAFEEVFARRHGASQVIAFANGMVASAG